MADRCPQDGGFLGDAGCTHPNHEHSELVRRILADTPPDMVSIADADAALSEGFYVDGPNGRVGFGRNLKAHIEAHPQKDADGRKARLRFAIDAVRSPDTVETDHKDLDGRTAYMKSFDGFGVMVVSGKAGDGVEDVFTFVPKRSLRKKGLPPIQAPEGTH